MEIKDIRKLTTEELNKKVIATKLELFDLRLKQATGSLDKTHKIRELRKDVAKMKTIINEKNRGGNK